MSDLEEQLRNWRVLESRASAAEDRLNALHANSPEFAQLSRRANEERRIADDFFCGILRGT
jgi:hypothetical protein